MHRGATREYPLNIEIKRRSIANEKQFIMSLTIYYSSFQWLGKYAVVKIFLVNTKCFYSTRGIKAFCVWWEQRGSNPHVFGTEVLETSAYASSAMLPKRLIVGKHGRRARIMRATHSA